MINSVAKSLDLMRKQVKKFPVEESTFVLGLMHAE